MHSLATLLVWVSVMSAAVSVLYTLSAASLVRLRANKGTASGHVPVTLLKPLYLNEVGLEDNLRSFFEQDYEGPIQIVVGVHSERDPALRIAEKLHREFPRTDVSFIIDPSVEGANPKIANLVNMVGHAKHEILIASDSDIRVSGNYVRTIAGELEQPNVGAITCLYRGLALGNLWPTLQAMQVDFQFLPSVAFGTALKLTKPCFGSTIALRRGTLEEIGGFIAMSHHLADDYEIGRAVREKGYLVNFSSMVVQHACSERSLADLLRHEIRWSKTVRFLNAPGHLGSYITHTLPLAMIAALALGDRNFMGTGFLLIAAALVSRYWLAWRVRSVIGSQAGPLWLLPARDVLSFAVFLASFVGKSVYWRGTRYLADADGTLAPR